MVPKVLTGSRRRGLGSDVCTLWLAVPFRFSQLSADVGLIRGVQSLLRHLKLHKFTGSAKLLLLSRSTPPGTHERELSHARMEPLELLDAAACSAADLSAAIQRSVNAGSGGLLLFSYPVSSGHLAHLKGLAATSLRSGEEKQVFSA